MDTYQLRHIENEIVPIPWCLFERFMPWIRVRTARIAITRPKMTVAVTSGVISDRLSSLSQCENGQLELQALA